MVMGKKGGYDNAHTKYIPLLILWKLLTQILMKNSCGEYNCILWLIFGES
jgi:hypothetical protein